MNGRAISLNWLLLLTGVSLAQPVAQDATGPFVTGGKGKRATIILASSLSKKERAAAKDFAQYLRRITGAQVPIKEDTEGVTGLRIHIGRTEYVQGQRLGLETLHIDGYIIKLIDGNNLVIAGGENLGTGFGISDFLKRICGVRWFMPGPLGEVVPKKKETVLDGIDIRGEPSVESVWLRPIHIDNFKVKHFRRYHWAGHSLKRLVPPAEHGEAHAEHYPLVGGTRRVPLGKRFPWQPCVTNPAVAKLVPTLARRHFAKIRTAAYVQWV